MKQKRHVIGVVLIAIMLFSVTTSRASADIMMGSYNTGYITYAFAGSYSTAYQDQLASYFKQWDAATSKITMTKATLVHEVGHALSMAHCLGTPGHGSLNHIIHQGIKNYTTVSTYEKNELIKKWGK